MGRTKKEKTRNLKENGNNREFEISQIPFAFEFECNRPYSNSVTVCHRIAIWPFDQFFPNRLNGNLVTNSCSIAIRTITLKLKRKRNLSYSECTNNHFSA